MSYNIKKILLSLSLIISLSFSAMSDAHAVSDLQVTISDPSMGATSTITLEFTLDETWEGTGYQAIPGTFVLLYTFEFIDVMLPNFTIAHITNGDVTSPDGSVPGSFIPVYSVETWEDIFGDDLGYALMRDRGLNPYGLSYFASDDAIEKKSDAIKAMVQVTKKAFAACLSNPAPCADALSEAASMKQSDALRQFEYSARVMTGDLAVGAWDGKRVAEDYDVVNDSYEITAFDPASAFTNEFIDYSITYP